ncbi:hypothetical protein [Pseudomarimonas arenosa]|uniref:Molecular chaperone n=1 Tax=Pseudomarimonas arenosa TaxID=2774145 RepID=A0AAW3ZDC7_9GAMM|nr:hypothetical protein [Pseudomarimonas arenosa]MBD8524325.1 hypothetical protein [Pseudomarimonas arenosa]
MSDAYRRLCEGLPPRHAPDQSSFPTDPRRVKAWVEALPRANQAATYKQLDDALDSLCEVHLDGAARLGVLESLRLPLLEAITALELQCQGGGIPLSAAKARAFEQLYSFESALARCYRLAAIEYCAPSGSVPLLRGGSVATCLERAAYHTARCLMLSYFLYHQPVAGSWSALHAVHEFAVSCRLDEKSIDEAAEGRATNVKQLYLQSLLVALSNPYRFSQREQADFWKLSANLVAYVGLTTSGSGDAHPVPVGSDAGPGYTAGERADEGGLWIDLGPLRQQLDQALAASDRDLIVLRFKGARPQEVPADLLRRIIGGWGRASSRRNQRLSAGHELETVLGLGSLHFHLSGMLDFDTFLGRAGVSEENEDKQRAAWARAPVDAGRIPVHRAEVIDQSLGGYHLHWGSEEGIKARVGELIGLAISSMEDGRHWLLGMLRWLRFAQDGSVDAGIELLSRYPRPVAIRSMEGGDAGRHAHRAIEYRPLKGEKEAQLYFAAPTSLVGKQARLQVLRVAEQSDIEHPVPLKVQAGDTTRLEESGDFVLLTADLGRA